MFDPCKRLILVFVCFNCYYRRRRTLLGDRPLAEVYLEPGTVQNHNRTVLDRLGGRIVPLDTLSRLNHYLRLFLGQFVVLGNFKILLGQETSTNGAVRHRGQIVPLMLRVPPRRRQDL